MNNQFTLVTGANGFVGSALMKMLSERLIPARGITRGIPQDSRSMQVPPLEFASNLHPCLDGCSSIVHLAARVHCENANRINSNALYHRANVEGTMNLARQAAESGVRRFIFVSSIKVNGAGTSPGKPFKSHDSAKPIDAYAVSKLNAELALRELADKTALEVVIVRPPLVYGPGVGANFRRMMDWIYRGWPLPLNSISNRRSLVALENLLDLLVVCLTHPAAINEIFLISDESDISTPELLRRTAYWMGKSAKLIPFPVEILRLGAGLFGKSEMAGRLCDSLQVDISHTRDLLNWRPPIAMDAALKETTKHFIEMRSMASIFHGSNRY